MIDPNQILKDLEKNHAEVELCDVVAVILESIYLLDKESENFKRVRERNEYDYDSMMRTLIMTLAANLSIIGKTKEEIAEVMKRMNEGRDDKKVAAYIVEAKKWDA